MSNFLHIYATSRAIRAKKQEFLNKNSLLPYMATIGDFESKAITVGNRGLVDESLRAIYLKEAADFSEFKALKSDLNLLKFYTQADDFFRFFEEVNAEGVSIEELYYADSYAEFDRDLNILKKLLENYKSVLDKYGLTDRIFTPESFKLNLPYINGFDGFVLELEGFLTKFELKLFLEIAEIKPFIVKIRTNIFNSKIVKNFRELGIDLPLDAEIEFNLGTKEIISVKKSSLKVNSEVVEVSQRFEQIAIAFAKIEEFVSSGIAPEDIVLIVPDESIATVLEAYDRLNNLNFAMGKSFKNHKSYIVLDELYGALRGEELSKDYLKLNGYSIENDKLNSVVSVAEFFNTLAELKLPLYMAENLEKELDKLNLLQNYFKFNRVFKGRSYDFKTWLFLWLSRLKEHTLDDTRGGKVTVMGLLESRGVSFEGVVIIDFNDGYVPSISNKDRFLNSSVRAHAKLPTIDDRESLQKYYYTRVLESAKKSCLIYQKSTTVVPSKFLYELGLEGNVLKYKVPLEILYDLKSGYNAKSYQEDIEVDFNAKNLTWSATMLKSFLRCKREFYYKYIVGLKEPQSSELNEGRELHNLLAKVLTPNCKYSSFDELKKSFLIELGKLEGDIELLYKKPLWINMLEPFLKSQVEHLNSGWSIEDIEFKRYTQIGKLKFSGVVDRLDKKEGLYLLLDYKSGSIAAANKKDVERLEDFQMNIYAKLLDKPVNSINFAFIELLNGGKVSYLEGFEEKEQKLLEHVEYLENLTSLRASRCDNLQNCRYCPYQLLCHRGEYL